jgi:hypothetical protein
LAAPPGKASPEQLGAALKKFQASESLAETGYADAKTLRKLGLEPEDVNRTPQSPGPTPKE